MLLLGAVPDYVIDIHEHTVYGERGPEQLVRRQRAMGVAQPVLLPVGTRPGLTQGPAARRPESQLFRRARDNAE